MGYAGGIFFWQPRCALLAISYLSARGAWRRGTRHPFTVAIGGYHISRRFVSRRLWLLFLVQRPPQGAVDHILAVTWLNPHVYLDMVVILGSVALVSWWPRQIAAIFPAALFSDSLSSLVLRPGAHCRTTGALVDIAVRAVLY
ncbi:hypothetical protein BG74_05280 [Sodalis-like endosymbiont of Proechinophthirus fluctus]|uniref:hypothetical protein n=1 Tax=Sodalis-like endosymbiont of Proechinophthirus fluctus TaxID=1462730 RepID=UPI0007A84DAD|nr:hypothetical protein BG74_05280 [Sodalis-like endosymbiont of Proechinophthirus fluctus]